MNKWNNAQFDDVYVIPTVPTPKFVPAKQVKVANVSSARDFWMGWTFEAKYVTDSRPETRWHSENGPAPHSITLDLGGKREIVGLWLRNRFDKAKGIITKYRIEVSLNGHNFKEVAKGSWPVSSSAQLATWNPKVTARYVRLIALDQFGNRASASEIKIITDLP